MYPGSEFGGCPYCTGAYIVRNHVEQGDADCNGGFYGLSREDDNLLSGGLFEYHDEIVRGMYRRTASPIDPAKCEPRDALITYVEADRNDVNVYRGPAAHYELVETIPALHVLGDARKITGRNADSTWWQIETERGSGWVSASEIAAKNLEIPVPIVETPVLPPIPAPAQPMVKALNIAINIREGPGTNYIAIGDLLVDQPLPVTGRNTDSTWWRVPVDGSTGWVAAAVTELINPDNVEIPVVESLPTPAPPGGTCPDGPGAHPEIDEHEQWMFDAINQFRAENGKPALVWDENLNKSADWFAGSTYTGSHVDSLGNGIDARVRCFGFTQIATEVLASVNSFQVHEGAEEALHFWLVDSPSHREQLELVNPQFVGVGHSLNPPGASHDWVWVVTFGPLQ